MTVSYKGFTASFWGNIDGHEKTTQNFHPDDPGHQSFNETDLTFSYSYTLDKWSFTGGYIHYGQEFKDSQHTIDY